MKVITTQPFGSVTCVVEHIHMHVLHNTLSREILILLYCFVVGSIARIEYVKINEAVANIWISVDTTEVCCK
jgi:hypothetical protein